MNNRTPSRTDGNARTIGDLGLAAVATASCAMCGVASRDDRMGGRLIWRGNDQVMQSDSDLGYRNNHWNLVRGDRISPLDPSLAM